MHLYYLSYGLDIIILISYAAKFCKNSLLIRLATYIMLWSPHRREYYRIYSCGDNIRVGMLFCVFLVGR